MATEKKLKDPTEAALSAIEQALSLDDPIPGDPPERKAEVHRLPVEPTLPDVEDHDFTSGPFRGLGDIPLEPASHAFDSEERQSSRPAFVAPDRTAVANDDRQSVGMMLHALQIRPSPRAYVYATLLSILWVGGLAAIAFSQGTASADGLFAAYTPVQLTLGGFVFFAPVVLFFIAAMLAVRSQEMKLVARAVGEVAVRLSQPENFSTDAVLSVSQAVRREVAAVGDGVERALARAGELETLVRSEISTLERAYADNEIRIRSLIDELVAQREAVVSNAERVRSAISHSHQNLTHDLDEATHRVVSAVNAAGDRVSGSIEQRGEQITLALGRAGERVVDDMASRGVELVERLTGASEEIKIGITEVGTSVSMTLESKAREIADAFEQTGEALTHNLHDGTNRLTQTLAESGR
jgi:hypothetical protein